MTGDEIQRTTTSVGDPAWRVTGHDLVRQLLTDPRLDVYHDEPERAARCFASGPFGPPQRATPTAAAEHQRMRRLVGRFMSARRLTEVRPMVSAVVDGLLDQLADSARPADFHRLVSRPLPTRVLCELFDIPAEDRDMFSGWLLAAIRSDDPAAAGSAFGGLTSYLPELIERRGKDLGTDIASELAAAGQREPDHWSLPALTRVAMLVLLAGIGPTMDAVDDGLVLLLTHPDQWAAVRRDPGTIDGAVEEMLRLSAMTGTSDDVPFGIPRWTNTEMRVDGVTIGAGELVLLDIDSANRDHRYMADPHRLDIHRENRISLIFGAGAHYCLGAPLARLQLRILFGALSQRFPNARLAVPVAELRPRDSRLAVGTTALAVEW